MIHKFQDNSEATKVSTKIATKVERLTVFSRITHHFLYPKNPYSSSLVCIIPTTLRCVPSRRKVR